MKTTRLAAGDRAVARELFALMAEVFAAYLDRLLDDLAVRPDHQRQGVGRSLTHSRDAAAHAGMGAT